MIRKILAIAGTGLYLASVAGCGTETELGNNNQNVTPSAGGLCEFLDGRSYYTAGLGEGGISPDGIWLRHWSAHFDGGEVRLDQSDFGMFGNYQCDGDTVTLSLSGGDEMTIEFDSPATDALSPTERYSSFSFNPIGTEQKLYELKDGVSSTQDCELVRGESYRMPLVEGDPIPTERPFVMFGERQSVEYDITGSGGAPVQGTYDCDMGVIHLHSAENDTRPLQVSVDDAAAGQITVRDGSLTVSMKLFEEGVSDCTAAPRQMCVQEPQNLTCFSEPCPLGVHKTILASGCIDEIPDPYTLVKEGECGELEGQQFFAEQEFCTEEYAPVCGVKPVSEPCQTAPCPARVYQTYSNRCKADYGQVHVVSEQACPEELEGQAASGPLSGGCTAHYDPVCGKAKTGIQCVTAPCDNYAFKTYGNQCEAFLALADVSFAGECGTGLEGVPTFESPTVRLSEALPETTKSVNVSDVQWDGDIVSFNLSYSGCSPQHFDFHISTAFKESFPVQVDAVFKPMVEDFCDAHWTSEFSYDLKPLKHLYQQAYQTDTGKIQIEGIGLYEF